MTPATLALARRWRAAPGFRWLRCLPLVDKHGGRYIVRFPNDWTLTDYDAERYRKRWFPDPTDPAAPGLALHMLREVSGDPHIHCRFEPGSGWGVYRWCPDIEDWRDLAYGDTEIAAIVAAMEAQR